MGFNEFDIRGEDIQQILPEDGVGGGAGGGAGGGEVPTPTPTIEATCAQPGQSCRENKNCCNNRCVDLGLSWAPFEIFGGICYVETPTPTPTSTPKPTPTPTPTSPTPTSPTQCPAAGTLAQVCKTKDSLIYTGQRDPVTKECLTETKIDGCLRTVTLIAVPSAGGKVGGFSAFQTVADAQSVGIKFVIGQVVNFHATPNSGYTFAGWYYNNTLWSSNTNPSIVYGENQTYEARFTPSTTSPTPTPNFATPTPTLIVQPTSTPTPIPRWRRCSDGELENGTPPSSYVSRIYPGAGGGICWEPGGQVGFIPALNDALTFTYQRGSAELPQAKTIRAENPSNVLTYRVTMETNTNVIIEPRSFRLPPNGSQTFSVNVTPQLLTQLGDGTSVLDLNVVVEQE